MKTFWTKKNIAIVLAVLLVVAVVVLCITLRQKRVALGHKPDDHELEQQQGFSMKFHM